jgi:hypothetical protein
MKDLTGRNIKSLQGNSRLISIQGEEAVMVEKYKGKVSIYVCVLEDHVVKSFFAFHELEQEELSQFLDAVDPSKKLTPGLRIGPLCKGDHFRRIIVRINKKKEATHFIKVEPLSRKDRGWEHNGSGWSSITNLGGKAPGLIIFIRDIPDEALIQIDERYTKEGVFFLSEGYEVYIENVKERYAFGKLIPRGL